MEIERLLKSQVSIIVNCHKYGYCSGKIDIRRGKIMQGVEMTKIYYVYIMTNKSRTLYTGMTSDLKKRVWEHKQKLVEGFTKKYNISRLVYWEETGDVRSAIIREKQIKGWLRAKKIALIETMNTEWKDLSEDW